MTKVFLFCAGLLFLQQGLSQELQVTGLRCEYRINPLGVDAGQPRLSWEMQSHNKNVAQEAYRILVSDDSLLLNKNTGNVWDSKKVNAPGIPFAMYKGPTLGSNKKYYWKVTVWDNRGNTASGKMAFWQMGLLTVADWNGADWIAYDTFPADKRIVPFAHGGGPKEWGPRPDVLPLFRKTLTVNKPVRSATAYICGLGHFEMTINGKKAGDHFLDPGWTKYEKHAQYVSFDITPMVNRGVNAVGIMLGNGFYYIPGDRYRKLTGGFGYPKMKASIVINYVDGTTDNVVSDASWKTAPSPIYFSGIYGGEDYDANKEQAGWNLSSFSDISWHNAVITGGPQLLQSQMQEPLKIVDAFDPRSKKELKPGVWVYDLGQNFSGIPGVTLSGKRGDTIRLYMAELLNDDGTIDQKATGSPYYCTYVLKGNGEEKWQPRFTYYGFRYIEVEGAVPASEVNDGHLPVIKALKGLHVRNSAAAIGRFECSNELFNRTNNLIRWAIRSNTMSVFTDCPHREKLGWLEETHLMGSSVQYNYDIAALCKKVINDMINSQTGEGLVPDIAPEYVEFGGGFRDSPEWGSAAVIFPWYAYKWYGDERFLTMAYDMMKKYVAYLKQKSAGNILSYGLGDWFDIGPNPPGVSQLTPLGLTATAMYYYDLTILAKVSAILGKKEEAGYYNAEAALGKQSFNEKYFDRKTFQYATGSQASNAMALYMNLVPAEYKQAVLQNLVSDIRKRDNALSAGDVGYRYVLRALEDAKRSDVIFDMNSRSDVPGYGYQLAHGATALTESWQAYRSVSNNHFMLGHLMEWFYSGLCGIQQAENSTGFKEMEIRPQPAGDVHFAKASYRSVYGQVAVEWKKDKGIFELNLTIPCNTSATVYFPEWCKKAPAKIGSGVYKYLMKY